MKKLHYQKEVMASWKKCMEGGFLHNAKSPVICVRPIDLKERQGENLVLIEAFEYCMGLIKDLIPAQTAFLLVDTCGILLKKNERK